MKTTQYSGMEPGIILPHLPSNIGGDAFAVEIPSLPYGAHPIIDERNNDCVGFVQESTSKVWRIFGLSGELLRIEEAPLEAPTIDPYDLILVAPAALKFVRAGFAPMVRIATGQASDFATAKITSDVLSMLRSRVRGLSVQRLQFTNKTANHMANPGRFVPVHILHLAIKYGRRLPDPQQIPGVFRYEIRMTRFVKRGDGYTRVQKTLEIVVREADWTILHFMYY